MSYGPRFKRCHAPAGAVPGNRSSCRHAHTAADDCATDRHQGSLLSADVAPPGQSPVLRALPVGGTELGDSIRCLHTPAAITSFIPALEVSSIDSSIFANLFPRTGSSGIARLPGRRTPADTARVQSQHEIGASSDCAWIPVRPYAPSRQLLPRL